MKRRTLSTAITSLAVLFMLALSTTYFPAHASTLSGPQAYYLALGDSLAFGYQPDGVFNQGYADQLNASFAVSHTQLINMGCPNETAATFISGECPSDSMLKYPYTGPQLPAALAFIQAHPGQVSPVTVDIGINDIRAVVNPATCTELPSYYVNRAIQQMDSNYTYILTQLKTALRGSGDLVTMNYYNPFASQCPNFNALFQTVNQHLAADAAKVGVPLANVYNAFGGSVSPNPNLCTDTWMCSQYNDVHPTDHGYSIITTEFHGVLSF